MEEEKKKKPKKSEKSGFKSFRDRSTRKMEETFMKKLIKTILFAAVGFYIGTVISGGEFAIQMGIGFMGLPAGFAFTSRYFIGYSLITIAVQLMVSVLIGWIILPFSLASGMIQTYRELKGRA